MMSFRGDYLARLTVPTAAVWLIGDIMEGKGRHTASTSGATSVWSA
jgi:hypothetical protein